MNAIITGATEGIGKANAEYLASKNYNLHLSARNEKKLNDLKKNLNDQFPNLKIIIFSGDLSKKKNVLELGHHILTNFNSVDILINNVGLYIPGQIKNESDSLLETLIETNLYSAYYLTRYLLEQMTNQDNAHIFNICSVASLKPYPNGGAYSISKYALLGFSENLREELKNTNIKVTTVCPGATMSKSWENSSVDSNRIMEASDIAKVIFNATLLSKAALVEKIILTPQKGDL